MRPRRPAADLRPRPRLSPRPLRPGRASALAVGLALAAAACGGDSEEATGPEPEPNRAPAAVIEAPASDTTVNEGEEVTLEGSATDPEDGRLTGDALRWASDVDGELGTGETVATTLTPDTSHTVTLTATDSEGATDEQDVGVAVELNQKPAAKIESPSGDTTVSEGDEVTFRGSASDPEDGRLTGDALRWSSDVDGELGTGDSVTTTLTPDTAHTVTLTATDSHGATGTAGLGLSVLGSFRPRSDTELSGEQEFSDVEIPEGVTVTVTGDLTLRATGAVTVGGEMAGDCVEAEVLADSTLAVTGTMNTACGELPDAEAPGLKLVGEGGFELDEAEVRASGDIVVATDPEASADTASGSVGSDAGTVGSGSLFASRPPGPTAEVSGLAAAEGDTVVRKCDVSFSTIEVDPRRAKKGEDGTRRGERGKNGSNVLVLCTTTGEAVVAEMHISVSTLRAQHGGHGGDATNEGTSDPVEALAGPGGYGGAVQIRLEGTEDSDDDLLELNIGSSTLEAGDGGDGGDATATALQAGPRSKQAPSARARGGAGNITGIRASSGNVEFSANQIIATDLEIVCGNGGAGGDAEATGADGLSEPAQVGGDARAFAGDQRELGVRSCLRFLGSAQISELGGTVTLGDGGSGGRAVAKPGDGGDAVSESEEGGDGGSGSAIFPDAAASDTEFDPARDGAPAGDGTAFGGNGGGLKPLGLNRESQNINVDLGNSVPGSGGDAVFKDGRGGNGAERCDPVEEGGKGGQGADVLAPELPEFHPGAPGGEGATWGDLEVTNFGNGGDGRDGDPPGERGAAGKLNFGIPQAWDGNLRRNGENFQPGEPGGPCGTQVSFLFNEGDDSSNDQVAFVDADNPPTDYPIQSFESDNIENFGEGPRGGDIISIEWLPPESLVIEEKPSGGFPEIVQLSWTDGTKQSIADGFDPAATPTGELIYVSLSPSGEKGDMYSFDVATNTKEQITDFPNLDVIQPDVGEDLGQIVFAARPEDGTQSLDNYAVRYNREILTEDEVENLTDSPEDERNANLAPGGDRFSFERVQEENGSRTNTVWVFFAEDGTIAPSVGHGAAGAAAGGETQVAPGLGFAQSPDWCPDGGSLVFIGEGTSGNPDLFRADADGSGVENLTRTPNRGEFEPDCAGEFVAYVTAFRDAEGNTAAELFRLDFGGGEPTQLTDLNGVVQHPAVEP